MRFSLAFGSVGAERVEAACAAIGNAAALPIANAECAALVGELHAALVEVAPLIVDLVEQPQLHGLAVEARAAAAPPPS